MNNIKIEKIEFENFRQYQSGSISFSEQGKNQLSVIIAKNGTGKTTILNAITWCLYATEKHLPEDKQVLSILNSGILRKSAENEVKNVSVEIIISDDSRIINFKRTQNFGVIRNSDGIKEAKPGSSRFTAAITYKKGILNTDIKEGDQAETLVKQYFDEDICNFYFFDGEKLSEFFAPGRSDIIKTSIFNISQVKLIDNAITRLNKIKVGLSRKLSQNLPDMDALLDQLDEANNDLNDAKKRYDTAVQKSEALNSDLEIYNKQIEDLKPVKSLQEERNTIEANLKKIEEEEAEKKRGKAAFIRRYLILLNLYPRLKNANEYIIEKQEAGELPPSIDIDQVKEILEQHISNCPLCDNEITPHSISFLEDILKKNAVSSKTSNNLSRIMDPLKELINETQDYKNKRKQIEQELMDLNTQREADEKKWKDITESLKGYDFGEKEIQEKFRRAEDKRTQVLAELQAQQKEIGSSETAMDIYQNKVDQLNIDYEKALRKMGTQNEGARQLELIRKLSEQFEEVKNSIMAEMRTEIEENTDKYFNSMIWKQNTFGDIKIDENYAISVYNKDGIVMTGSLSATEQMALAYAYTLAIHEASGRNCPLVIDSPLGRVSDDNREKMAQALLETSKYKQIVMLLTPDEYSFEVKNLYGDNANVKTLKLSEDENLVEGLES